MPLTDTAIRKAKPAEKPYKLADEKGLYLLISPTGSKWWRQKYRFGGKEKLLSLGVYPDVSLKDARERRDEARKLLANGTDPGEAKKAEKQASSERTANSFETIAREWFAKHSATLAESNATRTIRRLERDLFPWIGNRPIAEITPPELLTVLRRIEARTTDTALRAKVSCGQIFRYAVQTGRCERDPTADLRGALTNLPDKHFAALTDPREVGALMRAIDAFKGTQVVASALRLAPLVFVRPGELRQAQWVDIDLERMEWRFTTSKTKTEHLVPLSSQAVTILRELFPLTGAGRFVFPGGRTNKRAMSEAALGAALRRMGFSTQKEITPHGFRAMARTLLHEELGFAPEVIEHQLAHKVPDALGAAYNRTKFLKERRAMMQLWADYLDKLKSGAEVIPLHGSAA
ncbi:tyrosine-type recombinase/integrase [Propionivibrio sp.]|uniref:tyrosine-type recombinase/integrase n=1 Tax=Propionivibrio sp. TaxID=2212460 RepID=UPI0039E589BB